MAQFKLLKQIQALSYRQLCLLGTFVLLAFPIQAQEKSGTEGVSFDEAVVRTLENNPSLIALGYEMQAQEARVLQSGIKPRPELSIEVENFLGTGEQSTFSSLQTTFNITWVLERGSRDRIVNAAKAATPVIVNNIKIRQLDAVAETARRYLVCLELQARMDNAQDGIRLAENTAEAILVRVDAGSAPAADLARARAELARRELLVEDIEHELRSAYYRLGAQWGKLSPPFAMVTGNIFSKPEIESFEALKAKLESNPDLTKFLSQQRLNEAQLALEQAKNRQNWSVSAGFRRIEATSDQAFVAGFSMPLGKQNANRGGVEEVRANMARTQQEAVAEQVRLETELYVLYQELRHSLELTEALTNNIIPLYELALNETQQAYDLGRYSYVELNAVQSELLSIRYDLIDASLSIFEHLIEVERLTGVQVDVPLFAQ